MAGFADAEAVSFRIGESGQTGRGEETRTPGLLLPKQVRYQLRYSPAVG